MENTLPPTQEVPSVQMLPAGDLASGEKTDYDVPGVLMDAKMLFKGNIKDKPEFLRTLAICSRET